MANLIIIGNGFDLAHDIKSGYKDFINHVINEQINSGKYDDLLNLSAIGSVDIFYQRLVLRNTLQL